MADPDAESPPDEHKVKTILIVEDDEGIGTFLVEVITSETAYHPLLVTSADEALERVKTLVPDLFLLDYQLAPTNGLKLFDQLQEIEPLQGIPAILMSANIPRKALADRQISGIEKPFSLDDLLGTIEQAFVS